MPRLASPEAICSVKFDRSEFAFQSSSPVSFAPCRPKSRQVRALRDSNFGIVRLVVDVARSLDGTIFPAEEKTRRATSDYPAGISRFLKVIDLSIGSTSD